MILYNMMKKLEKKNNSNKWLLSLFSLGTFKNANLKDLKETKYKDLEGMVYRLQLTYDEIIDILDKKYNAGSTNGYTLSTGLFKISDINLLSKCLVADEKKFKITKDDIRLRSNLNNIKTIKFIDFFF